MVQVTTEAVQGVAELLAAELKLARLELSLDLRLVLKRAALVALFALPLIVGYAFAMAALASFLATSWGPFAALGSVAALQLAVAGIGLQRALSALRRTALLERTGADVTRSVQQTRAALSGRQSHPEP